MAAVSICSDFGAQKKTKSDTVHYLPIYFPWSNGTRCHDLSFLNVELSANFFALLFHFHHYITRELQIKARMRYHQAPVEWLKPKALTAASAGEDVKTQEPSLVAGEDATRCSFITKCTQACHRGQQLCSLVLTPKSWNLRSLQKPTQQMFIAALFIITKNWKQPIVRRWVDKLWSTQTMNLTQWYEGISYQARKKTWWNLKIVILSEKS